MLAEQGRQAKAPRSQPRKQIEALRSGRRTGEWQMVGGEEEPRAVIIASEPLSSNSATWMPVPEYAMVHAEMDGDLPKFRVIPLAR